jgi:hypothetical protein
MEGRSDFNTRSPVLQTRRKLCEVNASQCTCIQFMPSEILHTAFVDWRKENLLAFLQFQWPDGVLLASPQNSPRNKHDYEGFEVFIAVVMKSIIFWDMTPCSPLSVNRRFGGTYRLFLQGR